MIVTPQPLDVCCCYADADEPSLGKLEKYLSLFKHEDLIASWHKHQICLGRTAPKSLISISIPPP